MRRALRRFATTLGILLILLAGAGWWLTSYIAPDEQLDLTYTPISIKDKAWDIIKNMKTELILTESDVNFLIKSGLQSQLPRAEETGALQLDENVRLDGAAFKLEQDELTARMNVTWQNTIAAELNATYRLEWQQDRIALRPQSLSLKGLPLPLRLLEPILIPLELPEQNYVSISNVAFEPGQIRIVFKVDVKLPF
jgi:hypothetical protein